MIVPGLLEKSRRRLMDGLRKVVAVDQVQIGNLENETRPKKMVQSNVTTDDPGAVVWEGADELTLRVHEEGGVRSFIDTT